MTFEEVLPALKAGKKIKNDNFVYFFSGTPIRLVNIIDTDYPDEVGLDYQLDFLDILADDWEIVE